MLDEPLLRRAAVFVVLFGLTVVIGAAGVTPADGGDAPTIEDLAVPAFTGPDTVAAVPPEAGSVQLSASAADEVVLIDAAHGATLDGDQLEPLVSTLVRNGAQVEFFTGSAGLNESLGRADAFVVIGADSEYSADELAGIERFAEAGGRVLLLNEPTRSAPGRGPLLIARPTGGGTPAPMTELASRFGIAYGNGYLYDMASYDVNYRNVYASPVDDAGIAAGVGQLVLHEAVPVEGPNVRFRTPATSELSKTRDPGRYAVITRSGNVVAVGDASVIGQAFYRRADNEVLVGNLLDFLVAGEKAPQTAPVSEAPGDTTAEPGPPTTAVPRAVQ